ncbi:MAG: hypothetical protein M3014_15125 [Chloroflexota bacterium]|nr:hypothetical protein [Chloroflexota bacterium]
MKHFATSSFWTHYNRLPEHIRELADKNFALLKDDSQHQSLHFKKIGRLWSVHVGLQYRALGLDKGGAIVWFWIGSHSDYESILKRE